ncbi:MAG: hypothetical protein HYY42_01365 [Chloroflexi bacterium]|nr:hypothetical protein [Chloroflexota bacterium]MBI2982834.1 hypothetical protein [Chloroflexota bacterium]
MPEKRTAKKAAAARKTATPKKATAPKKTAAAKTVARGPGAAVDGSGSPLRRASVDVRASETRLACPRCGTTRFGPEQRIRAESNRTVRYTILVCERGHTFAHPLVTPG